MKTLEIRVDQKAGRLHVKGTPFAGSRVGVAFSQYAGAATAELGLYAYDERVYESGGIAPRTRVFPPPGLRCVAMSQRTTNGALFLDLDTEEVLDLFSDGRRRPGERVGVMAYLWDRTVPEVVGTGTTAIEWSPVYFRPNGTPVTMKGDTGEKGDKGEKGEDAIPTPLTPDAITKVDATGKHLADAGVGAVWLGRRVSAFRNAAGTLVLTRA